MRHFLLSFLKIGVQNADILSLNSTQPTATVEWSLIGYEETHPNVYRKLFDLRDNKYFER